jgi:hypothetical protein
MARKLSGGIAGEPNISALQVAPTAVVTAAADQDITLSPLGNASLVITNNVQLNNQNDLRFADADSSNWVAFHAPTTIVADVTWTLPAADGLNNQVLTTNSSGTLSWTSKDIVIVNQILSATPHYVAITTTTSGIATALNVSTSKLSYRPSTGSLSLGGGTASTSRTSGTLIVTGGVGVSGSIYAGGDIVAYAASDIRLKDGLTKINNSLEKVLSISGYEYYWNDIAKEIYPERTTIDVGVVAQEIQKVLPSAVVERDDGYLAVNYDKIIPLLIEAIKTLKEELDIIKGAQ